MTNLYSVAWAAGLFDGEGCISIGYIRPSRRKDIVNPSYRLTVKVTMGCQQTVRCFGEVVRAGSFQNHASKKARVNSSYSWVAMSRKAEMVLKLLRPHLVTKAREADVGLRFMALPDGRTGGAHGCSPVDPALMLKRHRLYLECCRLKPRWRFRRKKPDEVPEAPRRV